jgi:hypothetical protein
MTDALDKPALPALPPLKTSGGTFAKLEEELRGNGNAEALAAADEKIAADEKAELDRMEAPPERASDYPPPTLPQSAGITAEEIRMTQEAAFKVGASPGQFRKLWQVALGAETFAADVKAMQADPRIRKQHGDAMGRELEARYGEDRAAELATFAIETIDNAFGEKSDLGRLFQHLIRINRPLLETFAKIGERAERRNQQR